MFEKMKPLEKHLGEFTYNSRAPFYNDDSDYITNAPSYYDDLARKNKLIKHLAMRIWDYDEELAKRFAAWDKNLEEFDDEVLRLLQEWMDDGTFDEIINDHIFNDLNDKIDTLQDDFNDFRSQINQEMEDFKSQLNQQISDFRQQMDQRFTNFESDMNDNLSEFENTIERQLYPIDADVPSSVARETFMTAMNNKARKMGLSNTHFNNAHGLHSTGQVTTILDSVTMGINAMGYNDITRAWGRFNYPVDIIGDNGRNFDIERTIEESSVDDNYIMYGGKTGTLRTGGITFNLLSTVGVRNEPYNFIGVVSTEGTSRNTATRELFDNAMTSIRNKMQFDFIRVLISNGNFDLDFEDWGVWAGNPTLDREEYFSFPQSLNVSGSTPQQLSKSIILTPGDIYYISAWVKSTRNNSGGVGFSLNYGTGAEDATIDRVTNGWEKVSMRFTAQRNESVIYFGSISSADLDGHVDRLVVINLTTSFGQTSEPSKSFLDGRNYTDVIAEYCAVVQTPPGGGLSTDNLQPIFQKRPNETIRPASMTKVMTAMMLLDHYPDLSKRMNLYTTDITGGSGTSLNIGDVFTLEDALHMLLIESNNTVAHAIARIVGKKLVIDSERY